MLHSLSKQIAHCHFRADECRELAALSEGAVDREFYLEREQAWLALARGDEFQERLDQMVKELERNKRRPHAPPIRLPPCPTCSVEMQFQARLPEKRMFVKTAMSFERAFFICPNCRRLNDKLVATPGG
jgi:uncharacterized protein with PIN domain